MILTIEAEKKGMEKKMRKMMIQNDRGMSAKMSRATLLILTPELVAENMTLKIKESLELNPPSEGTKARANSRSET